MSLSQAENDWLRIQNPAVLAKLGAVLYVLIDFDEIVSALRQGCEPVMEAVMQHWLMIS